MKIGVTGVTGYLGSTVGKTLLSKGNYVLRGSVRSLKNSAKVDPIKEAYKGFEDKYELVEADLTNRDSIFEFVKGCDSIIHVASPLPNLAKKMNPDEVIKPAVDGTLNVLHAAHEFKVKRVVWTSSVATISDTYGLKLLYDHEDFADEGMVDSVYSQSKILAEKAAWSYVEELKNSENPLELVTIHPAGIIGPTLNKETDFTSMNFIKNLAEGKYPMLPNIVFAFSDVRDWAEAHIKALTSPAYKRYIVCGNSYFFAEVAQWIREDFGSRGLNPSTRVMPHLVARCVAYFNPFIRNTLGRWGKRIKYDSSLAEKELEFVARPTRESLKEMIESLAAQGYLKLK